MSTDLTQLFLQAVAYPERVKSIVDRLNRPLSLQYYAFVLAAAVFVVLAWIVIARAYHQRHQPPAVCSDDDLLEELAGTHRLSRPQRALLIDLAAAVDLPSATYLFASPDRFQTAAAHLVRQSGRGDDALPVKLEALYDRLFGDT